jgi:hypothetical protein
MGVGSVTSLALDANDDAHIIYFEYPGLVLYFRQEASGWISETVGPGGGYASLVLDGGGQPHFSYGSSSLNYAYRDAGGWHTETVPTGGDWGSRGLYNALALDDAGRPHISYYHWGDTGDLKYALKDAGGWQIETVDSPGYVGEYTSIALDAAGRPRISYYDVSNGDLRYAYRVEGDHTVYLPLVLRGE